MTELKEKGLVPELRFPQFQGSEGWAPLALSELSDRIAQKVGEQKLTTVSITAGKGFVSQVEKFSRDISGKQYKNYIHLRNGEFSYNKGNSKKFPQGCVYKLKEFDEVAAPNAFLSFRFKPEYVSDFYPGYFESNAHGKQLARYITSGARSDGLLNIKPEDFFSIVLPTPLDRNEQQKIADCLSSIDDLITAHTKKLDALKDYKKGLLQQLFPAEGETVPQLRFPGYSGAWCVDNLDEYTTKVGSGITPRGGSQNYKNEGRAFVRSQNVGWGELLLDDVVYIEEAVHATFSATEIKENDVLLNITGASIGRSAVANKLVSGGNVNQHVCILRTKKDELNYFYLCHFILSSIGQAQIASFQAGGNREGLNFGQIRSFSVPFPPTLSEQKTIASCLNSIDYKITAQSAKIESLKAHKKGLMQKLFPSKDENQL